MADDFMKSYKPVVGSELARAIGFLVSEWSGSQGLLTTALADLMVGYKDAKEQNGDLLHAATIIGMDARVLMGLVRTVAPPRIGMDKKALIGNILDRMETVKNYRDRVAHCLWELDNGKLYAVTLKTVGKGNLKRHHVTTTEIFQHINELHKAAIELLDLLKSYGYLLYFISSPERPY